MALRLVNKINRQFVKNVCRSLSGKRDQLPEIEPIKEEIPEPPVLEKAPLEHYHVCRPRTTPLQRYSYEAQNEADMAKRNVAKQHLQPALLPEYYKPPLGINSCIYPDPVTESEKQSSGQARRFEESNTSKNVTLPLKVPKLASPFPDPVKVMHSHTVSDQEKAEQMMAESRMMRSMPENKQQPIRTLPPSRSYSTNKKDGDKDKKCKLGDKKKKMCVHMVAPCCKPPKTISCKRKPKMVPCTKKEAPYPSYSESCHDDPYEKPSECKMCPWKPDEHPSFKPPKSKYHTSSFLAAKKEECKNPSARKKKPCEWVEQDKKNQESLKSSGATKRTTKPDTKTASSSFPNLDEEDSASMFFATKPPCKKPQDGKCKKDTKKKGEKNKPASENKTKKTTAALRFAVDDWLRNLSPQEARVNGMSSLQSGDNMVVVSGAAFKMAAKKKPCGDDGKEKCKKFPFQKCSVPFPRKPPKERVDTSKCPKKKRPKPVQDCPGEKEDECKRSAAIMMGSGRNTFAAITGFSLKSGDSMKKEDKKCPKLNIDICKTEEDDDPCRKKRRGKTLICPTDLLKKNRRNPKKKKTAPLVPPRMPTTGPSRSTTNL